MVSHSFQGPLSFDNAEQLFVRFQVERFQLIAEFLRYDVFPNLFVTEASAFVSELINRLFENRFVENILSRIKVCLSASCF